jgi:hypothetical protein
MNKIEFNGKEILDLDKTKEAIEKTEKQVSSDDIKEIKIVTEYPDEEETGVLYIKLESQN